MIEIKLKNGQTGYDVIEPYVRRYWKYHNMVNTVVISMSTSYDGKTYEHHNEIASPYNNNDIEFLYDWWEGQRFIRLFGIMSLDGASVSGGIYMND